MKRLLFAACLGLLVLARPALATPPELDPQLKDTAFQYEVLRYVYLWYIDDRFFIETKLSLNDIPDVKVTVGWTFYH